MDKAGSTDRGSPMQALAAPALFRSSTLIPIIVFAVFSLLFGYWHVVLRAPAVTYGDVGQVRFSQRYAASGEKISMCFDSVTWHRLCPAELVTSLSPSATVKATRFDLPAYRISTPQKTGAVEPKCRPFEVPAGLAPGMWTLNGYARAECPPLGSWAPVVTNLPPVTLEIVTK